MSQLPRRSKGGAVLLAMALLFSSWAFVGTGSTRCSRRSPSWHVSRHAQEVKIGDEQEVKPSTEVKESAKDLEAKEALASAVGGWDPDHLAEDWHMFAKCAVKTEGRVRCVPIFLPVLNYTPEEDGYWETLCSRWTQAKRHALGVSEVVYVLSASFLAFLELPSWRRFFKFSWKMSPLLAKFTQTHFVNGMAGVWNVMAQLVIHVYMLGSWCYLQDLGGSRCDNDAQILRNSLLVYLQQRSTAIMAFASILSGGLGAIYFHMVKDRVEGNVNEHWKTRSLALMWLIIEIEVSLCGILQSFIFGALPLWIACIRIIGSIRFNHVVVGMVGRGPEEMQSP